MSTRIKKKFIEAKAIDGSKVLFLNEESFKALHGEQEVSLFKLNSSGKFIFEKLPEHSSDPQFDNELARKKYVDDKVMSEQLLREAGDTSEMNRAMAAEAGLQSQIDSLSSETSSDLAAEIAARIAGDNALDGRLDIVEGDETVVGSIAKALKDAKDYSDVEKSRAQQAEMDLQSAINNEASLRSSADTAEASARESADLVLDGKITTEKDRAMGVEAQLQSDLSSEVSRAQGAESVLDGKITTEKDRAMGVESQLQSDLDAEEARALAAEGVLDGKITTEKDRAMGEEARIEGKVDQEILDRQSAISALKGAVSPDYDTLKKIEDKIQNVLSNVDPTALDSLTEIVSAFQNADGDLTASISALSSSSSSALAAEVSRAEAAESALDARLDVLEQDPVTKAYVDSKDLEEKTRAMGVESQLQSDLDSEEARAMAAEGVLDGKITTEKDRAMGVEAQLQSDLDAEEARAMAAESVLDGKITTEKDRAMGVESQLQSDLTAEVSARQAAVSAEETARIAGDNALDARLDVLEQDPTTKTYVDGKVVDLTASINDVDGYAQDIRTDLDQEILDREADVNAEEARAMAAESTLQSNINAEQSARILAVSAEQSARESEDLSIRSDFAAADAAKLAEAKSYTDQKVADLVNSAPAVLDTLKELADAINGDASFASTVASNIGTAKQEAKDYADSQLNALGERFVKMSKVLSESDISNKYFDLSHKAFEFSMVVSIDRLMLIQDIDYTVSVVGGVSRVSFSEDFMNGPEAASLGDLVMVRYLKDVR